MKLEEILRTKGHDVVTITDSHSVLDAVQVLDVPPVAVPLPMLDPEPPAAPGRVAPL